MDGGACWYGLPEAIVFCIIAVPRWEGGTLLARWYAAAWGPKPQLPGVMGKRGPLLPKGWKKVGV
jgi:hypothetical protein